MHEFTRINKKTIDVTQISALRYGVKTWTAGIE